MMCAAGLFRATTAPAILAQRGAIFMHGLPGLLAAAGFRRDKIPTKQEVLHAGSCIFEPSYHAEHVDVFASHRWGSARRAMYLALCLCLNLPTAVGCSLTTWLLHGDCRHDRIHHQPYRQSPFASGFGWFSHRSFCCRLLVWPARCASLASHINVGGPSMYSPDRPRLQTSSDSSAPCLRCTVLLHACPLG